MPYGVDKSLGGDNESNTKWMEDCTKKVMNQGKDKSSAIAICKATLRKKKESKSELNDPELISEEIKEYEFFLDQAIRKLETVGHLPNESKTLAHQIYVATEGNLEKCKSLIDHNE